MSVTSDASSKDDFVTDFTRPDSIIKPRVRPQTLSLRKADFVTLDTLTPCSPIDSTFTGFADSITGTPANTPVNAHRIGDS